MAIGFLQIAAQQECGAQSWGPHFMGVQREAIEVSGCDQYDEGTLWHKEEQKGIISWDKTPKKVWVPAFSCLKGSCEEEKWLQT